MQRQFIIALAALMMAVPAASATWFAYGTYEPDTALDASGGFMRVNPTTAYGSKDLYFNVYQTEFPLGTSTNSGTAGSRIQMAGVQNHNAMLGPWRDCNDDGYVGFAESAVIVYRAELLLDDDICPASEGSFHNDGQWIYEYIPVGFQHTDVPTPTAHPRILEDKDALVWGDAGRPGAQGGGTCPISPFPHGTTSGSGWMIRYLDCFTSKRVVNTVNSLGPSPLFFDNTENPQKSTSLLNQHFPRSLFGNPETGETGIMQLDSNEDKANQHHSNREYAFTTWDCSGRAAEVKDPTGGQLRVIAVDDPTYDGEDGLIFGNYGKTDENLTDDEGNLAWVARPAPSSVNTDGSVADGLNETFMGFRVGGGDENHDTTVGGDCDFESDDAGGDNTYSGLHQTAFFRADAPFEPSSTSGKKATTDWFYFYNGGEMEGTTAEIFGSNAPNSIVSTPTTQYVGTIGAADPIWQSNTLWTTTPQSINRATLQPQGAIYWSFYAKVGATTLSAGWKTTGNEGTYGSEACGSHTSGTHNGWNCSQSAWYTDANGTPIVDGDEIWQAKVGFKYQFRDIDCYDGSVVRGLGVHASLVDVADPDGNPSTPDNVCADSPI